MDTLVLANNYIPINRVKWRRAITLILKGRAVIVAEYENKLVSSGRDVFPMPAVVRLVHATKNVFNWSRKTTLNKSNLWLRDKGRCQYCGEKLTKKSMTLDHVQPRSQGGKSVWENLVVACYNCNQRKRDMTPQQAGLALLSKPVQPKFLPGSGILSIMEDIPASWKDYFSSTYWDADILSA